MREQPTATCTRCATVRTVKTNRAASDYCGDCTWVISRQDHASHVAALPEGQWVKGKHGILRHVPAPGAVEITPERIPTVIRDKCGTVRGYRTHMDEYEKFCAGCLDAYNEYRRNLETKKRGGPGQRHFQPCGTHAAYRRHERAKEAACAACIKAEYIYKRDSKARRKQAA